MSPDVLLSDYAPAPDLLAGRVVLVTGAGVGIGRAASRAFARHGATVVLLGRTVPKLEAVYDEIVAAGGPEPAIYPMDLAGASSTDYDELAQRLRDGLGGLHGVLHNAALLGTLGPLEQLSPELWTHVLQVNLTAAFEITRATLPLLRAAPDASVVFTSAREGRRGRAYWGVYAVSKFATEGLMQVLADELENASRIRVNCVDPGPVRTALRASAYPGEDPREVRPPEDLVGAYLYLMGPDSRGTHGRTLELQREAPRADPTPGTG